MKIKNVFSLVLAIILSCLVFGGSSSALAAPPEGAGPPVDVVVIVHFPHQPDKVFSGTEGGPLVEQIGYVYEGWRWEGNGVTYYLNPGKISPALLAGIGPSFEAWDNASAFDITNGGITKSTPGSLQAKYNRRTGDFKGGLNVVGWKNLYQYPNAIGVTYIWASGTVLIEVDTALNSSSAFKWWQNPDGETWSFEDSPAYDVDVQNIMTHEAGHWLVLGDIYTDTPGFATGDGDLTMYGIATQGELKKRSLEAGDITGIRSIYGP